MTQERYNRVTDTRQRYMDNIYRTRRSQADRRRVRLALAKGGDVLSKAMEDILNRKYERKAYMGLSEG